jgi:hypothetical protein
MRRISSYDETKLPFAESLLQKKKFRFQKRNGRLDLRGLREIDVSKVINEMDVDTLQRYLENLTYSEVCADDFRLYSEDCLVRLFQVAQLTLEYLLNVQDTLAINLNSLAAKYASQKREMKELQALMSEKERKISGFYVGTGENFEPSIDECSEGHIVMKPGKNQDEDLTKHVRQMCYLLTALRDDIANESKRIFEDAIERKVEPFLSSLACQQRDCLRSLGEQIIQQFKENTDNHADQLLQSISQYLSGHQSDAISLALKTYEEEKIQERSFKSCYSMADKETESYDLCNDNKGNGFNGSILDETHGTLHQTIGNIDVGSLETATDKDPHFSEQKSSDVCPSSTPQSNVSDREISKSNLKHKNRAGIFLIDLFLPCRHRKGSNTHHIKSGC